MQVRVACTSDWPSDLLEGGRESCGPIMSSMLVRWDMLTFVEEAAEPVVSMDAEVAAPDEAVHRNGVTCSVPEEAELPEAVRAGGIEWDLFAVIDGLQEGEVVGVGDDEAPGVLPQAQVQQLGVPGV
jgi:hypothetical protein